MLGCMRARGYLSKPVCFIEMSGDSGGTVLCDLADLLEKVPGANIYGQNWSFVLVNKAGPRQHPLAGRMSETGKAIEVIQASSISDLVLDVALEVHKVDVSGKILVAVSELNGREGDRALRSLVASRVARKKVVCFAIGSQLNNLWTCYSGAHFLKASGIGSKEFSLASGMTMWAINPVYESDSSKKLIRTQMEERYEYEWLKIMFN